MGGGRQGGGGGGRGEEGERRGRKEVLRQALLEQGRAGQKGLGQAMLQQGLGQAILQQQGGAGGCFGAEWGSGGPIPRQPLRTSRSTAAGSRAAWIAQEAPPGPLTSAWASLTRSSSRRAWWDL